MASQALLQELCRVIHDDYGQEIDPKQASDIAEAIVGYLSIVINNEYEK